MGANGIYGLSGSGLDIESLVKMGMLNKQNQYDKMYQKEVQNTWLKEAYNDVYKQVSGLKDSMSTFKMQSNMSAMQATSTNNDVVSVSANGAAAAMNHKVAVTSVASNAYLMTDSGQTITRNANATSEQSNLLADVVFGMKNVTDNGDGTYTIDDGSGNTTTVSAEDNAISLTIQDSATAKDKDGNPVSYKVEYNYKQLFGDKKTLNDLASAIAASGANIQGGYDSAQDSFSFYNKTSGKDNIIGLGANNDATVTLLNNLHLAQYNSADNSLTGVGTFTKVSSGIQPDMSFAGTNAAAVIDGKSYDLETNKIQVGGVTYNFNSVSAKNADGTYVTSTVNVSQDTDAIVKHVKDFVEAYNKVLDDLNSKLTEEKHSDYKPLTKKQEAEMTEAQIKQWNEKAKSGLLYHDSNIRSLISDMREAVYTPVKAVDSKYNSMSAIGITTTTNQGHITLDEDKLKKALADDPDCVYQLFASDQDSTYIAGSTNKNNNNNTAYNRKNDYQNTGVANRMYNLLGSAMTTIKNYAGDSVKTDDESYLGKTITNLQTKMSAFKTQMSAYEKQLYKKYDAMEVALSKLGVQLGYITGGNG